MKYIVLLSVINLVTSYNINNREDYNTLNKFNKFIKDYNKRYNSTEYKYRYNVFLKNIEHIERVNQENRGYELGLNKFADLTNTEFIGMYTGYKGKQTNHSKLVQINKNHFLQNHPDYVDWRASGLVTNIKDQGQCGSCWAFSAVATLEGQFAKKNKSLESLSEQNLVDCAYNFGNEGCDGGWPNAALSYVRYNHGIDDEDDYPYQAIDENCVYNKSDSVTSLHLVHNISSGNETELLTSLATIGPISVAIDAEDDFQFYKSGIFKSLSCSNTTLDHAVTAIGYGIDKVGNNSFYIIKNSWGTDWGMDGYIYFSMSIPNMCGIATASCYPII